MNYETARVKQFVKKLQIYPEKKKITTDNTENKHQD